MMKWMLAILVFGLLLFAGCPQEEYVPEDGNETDYVPPQILPDEPAAEPETIKVGFVGPLTGENSAEGIEALNSLKLSAYELSDNLYEYEIIEQDGGCTQEGAAEALEYLAEYRGVDIIIGGICPEEVEGMAPLLEEKGTILLALSEGASGSSYVMGMEGTSESIGAALADFCKEEKLMRTMVVTDGSQAALETKEAFDSAAKGKGLSTQPAQAYGPNFAATASVIKGYQPQVVVVLVSDGSTGAEVVNALRAAGVNSEILGDKVLVSPKAISAMGANSEGIYSVTSEFDDEGPIASYFLGNFESSYGEPSYVGLVGDARNALYLFAQAEDFYSYRATSQDLRNYWLNLDSWEGMGGTLYFVDGDRVSSFRKVQVSGGSAVGIE